MQEALLAAWQGLGGFEGRSSIRTWLYRIATTRCLNARRSVRRHRTAAEPPGARPPRPTRLGEVTWLEPYPDALLDGLPGADPGPEARYEAREAISLAFITAVQRLPPRQGAALILRDVLGFPASEAARILAVTDESLTSALKRARASLRDDMPARPRSRPPDRAAERDLAERLTRAYLAGDVAAIVALFSDDAWLAMPPFPLEYQGRELIGAFLASVAFRDGISAGRDSGQRPARVRRVPDRAAAHRYGCERADRARRGRRADRGDDPVPGRRAAPVRPGPVTSRNPPGHRPVGGREQYATNLHTRTAGVPRDPVSWAGCRFDGRPRRTPRSARFI